MRGIVQGRMVDAAHYERLLRIEAEAREVIAHEFVSENEWSGGWQAHKAKSLELLNALKAALGSLREGG